MTRLGMALTLATGAVVSMPATQAMPPAHARAMATLPADEVMAPLTAEARAAVGEPFAAAIEVDIEESYRRTFGMPAT